MTTLHALEVLQTHMPPLRVRRELRYYVARAHHLYHGFFVSVRGPLMCEAWIRYPFKEGG
jgi:hypothetical protein